MYISASRIKLSATASGRSQFSFHVETGMEKEEHTGGSKDTWRRICEILSAQKDGRGPCCVRNIVSLD